MATLNCDVIGMPTDVLEWCRSAPQIVERAYQHSDAISLAAEVGRLDVLSVILGSFGLLLGFAALVGFWLVRREAIAKAKETAEAAAPALLADYMRKNGSALIREALNDAEAVSAIQAEVMRLGIRDASEADVVDEGELPPEDEEGEK